MSTGVIIFIAVNTLVGAGMTVLAGPYIRISVTFDASDEKDEDRIISSVPALERPNIFLVNENCH